MILRLSALPGTLRGPADPSYKGRVPARALFMAPDAAKALLLLEKTSGGLVYSDIFRSAQSSLEAHRAKSGVQPPAYSPHNYGLAFDADVTATLRKLRINYPELSDMCGHFGFYCYRRDLDPNAAESWHFSYLGAHPEARLALADPQDRRTWARPVEAEIQARYGNDFALGVDAIRSALARLGYRVDLTMGDAIDKFQAAWDLQVDGVAGTKTQRVLAYVSAGRLIEPPVS